MTAARIRVGSRTIARAALLSALGVSCSNGGSGSAKDSGSGGSLTSGTGGGVTSLGGTTSVGGGDAAANSGGSGAGGAATPDGGASTGVGGNSAMIEPALRYRVVRLHVVGGSDCATVEGNSLGAASCGSGDQAFRISVLNSEYLSVVSDTTGRCVAASGDSLVFTECTNAPEQQFGYSGSASTGYTLTSFASKSAITSTLGLGTPASLEVIPSGAADALAVAVDERAIGWATMSADVIVPDGAVPNGDEATRAATGTTGGGSWEASRTKSFSNVYWFKPSDFSGSIRETSISAVASALSGSEARIVLFQAGTYDFSLSSPTAVNSCEGTCSNGSKYTEVGGFCNCSSVSCTANGYRDATRTIDIGSNKTILGLGSGATFRHSMMRVIRNSNLIFRNLAYQELPGDVRAWDDALLFYPGDHAWVDHVSFSGFGRGAVVLSGTRITTSSASFYTYRDTGWMTFSWISVDSSENWRCGGTEDSPYPFFTTDDPGLTFDHALFQHGHGRNPAIDGESAHFIDTAWQDVSDGLDGRGGAELLVEGCYFSGKIPIRMDDPAPPQVLAPWNASLLADRRRQVIFASDAWASIISDWGNRGLDMNTLNTNPVRVPTYPYGLDADPTKTLATVTAGAGVGKGGFPDCSLATANKAAYTCL